MKTIVKIATIALLFTPSVSFAALTQDQANSLIMVVQSSPTTPASAFTNLITTFSNITVPQAESLISVIQQAPGVPASAFVNMLLAFTVDPVVVQTYTPPVNNLGVVTPPVVESKAMESITIYKEEYIDTRDQYQPYGVYILRIAVIGTDGKHKKMVDIGVSAPDSLYPEKSGKTNAELGNNTGDWSFGFAYAPLSAGEKTLTFTHGDLTVSKTITVK